MYRKVIVGFIDSDEGRDAVALGALIARAAGSRLVLTGVFPAGPPQELIGDGVNKILEERELALGRKLQDAADAAGAEAEPFPSNSRARGLHDAATELEADLVVVGSSSRAGLGRVLAGNVALQLLHGSPCAVAVAPRGFARSEPHLAVIGVGIDGSDESTEALHAALDLGRAAGATLLLMAAAGVGHQSGLGWGYGIDNVADLVRAQFQSYLDRAADEVPDELLEATRLLRREAAQALTSEADDIDLLCVGSRGWGPVQRVLLGSESSELIRNAPCPILVVPRGAAVGSREEGEGRSKPMSDRGNSEAAPT
jgi:nucleotide-binding universal stress UspA family protein